LIEAFKPEDISWPLPSRHSELAAGEVHLWRICLETDSEAIHAGRAILSADEIVRADSFRFERDRRRFTMARAAMRRILAQYIGQEAQSLIFEYGSRGKPSLGSGADAKGVSFNLSHSHELSLLGVTGNLRLGVDIEFIGEKIAGDDIARRFFAVDELDYLAQLPEEQRTCAFFDLWTRKEAYIKALAEGLSVELNSFSMLPCKDAAVLSFSEGNPAQEKHWSAYAIRAGPAYRAALVVEGVAHKIVAAQWPPDAESLGG
jgi:4'-phosphopantetheinyl transferase